VGHWRFDALKRELVCSAETYRILERNPTKGPLTYLRVLSYVCREERGIAHRAARELLRHGTSCDLTLTALINQQKKFIHLRAQAITNRDGTVVGLVGTLQDNTQQKLYEGDLRAREQLLRAIYDNVPSGLGVVEASENSFRFISANPGTAKLLGLDSVNTTLAGRSLDALGLPQPAVNFWSQCFQTGIEQGTLSKFEPTTDSGRRHLSITLVPLGASASGNQQLCFLVEDITERKRIDAEMAQGRRLRAVGELVGGIAHEFNNLLTPILLKAELLSTEWRDEPRLLDELRTISRAAQRGADLTRRLLAFGRRTEPKPEEVHVSAMVNAVHDLVRPTIDRRIHLQCEVAESLPPLFLNPTDLHQIVLNLVLNARDTLVEKLEIRPPDSWRATIKIAAAQFGPSAIENTHWAPSDSPVGWVCLTVQDNGMGMAQEVLERIFEPFYTTKQVGKGTGLGLATVWHLVTRIGGKVTVQSRVNEGTIFQIWLPILPVKSASGPVVGKTSEEARTNARICLVEDDDLVAHTIASALRRQHHHVVHFRNGAEAWRHLSTQYARYDLLLLDLDLPGINGIEIARRARASRYAGKILVASGRLTETEARELDKIGVDLQIEKPFSPQKLHLAVQTCMAATGKPPARFEPVK
jgi:PAS domain S-box-containing protein